MQKVVVRVATSEAKTVNDREMPDICLQHMVAVMLVDKTASFEAAHDKPRMQDAAILRQRAKVQLVPDEDLERLYPRREAIVEVTLTDGTRLSERVAAVRGTSDNPMTREEVVAKARDLLTPVLGAATAGRLIESVLTLETVKDIRTLRPLLQRVRRLDPKGLRRALTHFRVCKSMCTADRSLRGKTLQPPVSRELPAAPGTGDLLLQRLLQQLRKRRDCRVCGGLPRAREYRSGRLSRRHPSGPLAPPPLLRFFRRPGALLNNPAGIVQDQP